MTASLHTALLAVQSEAPTLQKSAINPHFKSKFVPLDKVHEVVMPLLNKHGLIWSTSPGVTEGGSPVLHYALIHAETGVQLTGTMALLPSKQDPQGQGSAITYARRYSLMAVLGLVADEDDDGNAASTPKAKPNLAKSKAEFEKDLADKVADLPGTVELAGPQAVNALKELRKEVGLSPGSLKAHVVATHSKDSLDGLTPDEAEMVRLWLEQKRAVAA